MTTFTRRALIVIPADLAAQANGRAKEVDREGGEKTFTAGLVPAGSPPGTPPTHLWCSWQMTTGQHTAIRNRMRALPDPLSRVKVYDGNTTDPESVLAELGLERARPAEGI